MQAAGVYASPRRGRRSRQPKRERSRARTPMWASRLDSLVARRRMVREVYATRACRRKQRRIHQPVTGGRSGTSMKGPVGASTRGYIMSPAHARHHRLRRRRCSPAPRRRRSPTGPTCRIPWTATPAWCRAPARPCTCGPNRPARRHPSRRRASSAGPAARRGPYTVVADIPALGGWYASGDGLDVNVVWKSGGSVFVTRYDLSTGAGAYVPVPVCTDAQAATLRGVPGTTVVPAGIAADGQGGAYVWCSVSPAPATGGFTLINHVSATGALATSTPAMKVVERHGRQPWTATTPGTPSSAPHRRQRRRRRPPRP